MKKISDMKQQIIELDYLKLIQDIEKFGLEIQNKSYFIKNKTILS